MRVLFLGHAALKLTHPDGQAVLMDPWFSRSGAFFRSWFQFPENSHLLDLALDGATHICISHNHADHFDPETLQKACQRLPNLRIHIARFESSWFADWARRMLGPQSFRIEEHAPFEPFEVWPGMRFFFVPEESPAQIDSAMVCFSDHFSLVNLNDARLTTDQIGRIVKTIGRTSLLTLQASGASEYPINYSYEPEDMLRRCREKRRLKFAHAQAIIDSANPDRILFFAGPPVFLDRGLQTFNHRHADSVFPDQWDILQEMQTYRPDIADRSYFLLPGEMADDAYLWRRTHVFDPRLYPYTRKEEYCRSYTSSRADLFPYRFAESPADADLLRHFEMMTRVSEYMSRQIGGSITFHIQGETRRTTITADFQRQESRLGEDPSALYVLTAPAASVAEVLRGQAGWDDVFLSVRMNFIEQTDRFVSHFKPLLKYLDADLCRALERYEKRLNEAESQEMMTIDWQGKTLSVQRFCPHAGADLKKHGQLGEDGTLTCMAHRFCFDLRDGTCRTAHGFRLLTGTPPIRPAD